MNRTIHVNGINYDVKVVHTGEAVLLLHGFTGSNATWEKLLKEDKGYKMIAPSIVGHGKTDSPDEVERYSIESIVEDLVGILEHERIDKIHCVGYSMGGRIAQMLAVMYPDRISSLVLVSTSTGISTEEERRIRRDSDHRLAERIKSEGIESFVNFWEKIPLFKTNETHLNAVEKATLRKSRLANNPNGLMNSLLGTGVGNQPYLMDNLKDFHFPVLLINGELDKKYVEIMSEMAKQMPNCKNSTISDSGHTPHLEKSVEFGKIVIEFLKTV